MKHYAPAVGRQVLVEHIQYRFASPHTVKTHHFVAMFSTCDQNAFKRSLLQFEGTEMCRSSIKPDLADITRPLQQFLEMAYLRVTFGYKLWVKSKPDPNELTA